jgi:hypothetical protein
VAERAPRSSEREGLVGPEDTSRPTHSGGNTAGKRLQSAPDLRRRPPLGVAARRADARPRVRQRVLAPAAPAADAVAFHAGGLRLGVDVKVI